MCPLEGQQVPLLKTCCWCLMLRIQPPNCKKIDVYDEGGTVPQKFNCLPVTLILIAIGERYVPTREVQVAGGAQTWVRDSPEFLSSQKNSVRFAAEESNPTINHRLNCSAL